MRYTYAGISKPLAGVGTTQIGVGTYTNSSGTSVNLNDTDTNINANGAAWEALQAISKLEHYVVDSPRMWSVKSGEYIHAALYSSSTYSLIHQDN